MVAPLMSALFAGLLASSAESPHEHVVLERSQFEERTEGGHRILQVEWTPEQGWDMLTPSYDVLLPVLTQMAVTIEVFQEGVWGRAWHLGVWAHERQIRGSINGQSDGTGQVATDTLELPRLAQRLRITLTLSGRDPKGAEVNKVYLSLTDRSRQVDQREPLRSVWGTVLEPPRRAQSNYPNGDVICSPTALSMVIGYWAQTLQRPQIDRGVLETVEAVYDPGWEGTGNWTFNTSFAATVPGLDAAVVRLRDVRSVEELIARGIPVVTSVSYDLLKGRDKPSPGDGHLVVVVGFEVDGDPVFNDSGRNVVRMTYDRGAFIRAWSRSNNTAYLVAPRTWMTTDESRFER